MLTVKLLKDMGLHVEAPNVSNENELPVCFSSYVKRVPLLFPKILGEQFWRSIGDLANSSVAPYAQLSGEIHSATRVCCSGPLSSPLVAPVKSSYSFT